MTNIYEQHVAAFKRVQAYVILKGGARVATIAFKYPDEGAGRLYAYVHWIGLEMIRGSANGYGYDKSSAAVESAMEKLLATFQAPQDVSTRQRALDSGFQAFHTALQDIGGASWDGKLREAGFTVLQAV